MFCCIHFSKCACIVFTVACPAGYSLIYNPPRNTPNLSFTTSLLCVISLTETSVKQASYLLPTYFSLNSKYNV